MKKNEAFSRICALCVHACVTPVKPNSSTLFSLTADFFNTEEASISCPYKKNPSPADTCRRFSFDPLKYRPKTPPKIQALDEDSLLLD